MKKFVFIILACILTYTRFVNIGWGLPYPMHPDERNMANAVQQLSCPSLSSLVANRQSLTICLNPHFFAYGQFPLYIAYGGVQVYHIISGLTGQPTYEEATLALRAISALSTIALVFVLLKIMELVLGKKVFGLKYQILGFIFLIFQPYAIQFAHFGTTESLLMLFYSLIIYLSLKLLTTNRYLLITIFFLALFSGLALGTKVSSLIFLGIPFFIIVMTNLFRRTVAGVAIEGFPSTHKVLPAGFETRLSRKLGTITAPCAVSKAFAALGYFLGSVNRDGICRTTLYLFFYSIITCLFFIISSPQNLLNWNDFISSMTYESRVGLGRFVAFYTRQFVDTPPIIFQLTKILPYTLGLPTYIGGILGFFLLPSSVGVFIGKIFLSIFKVAKLKGPNSADKLPASRLGRFGALFGKGSILTESEKLTAILIDILRFSLLLSFLPPSFFFAKWTRFISPSFPLFSLFAILLIIDLYSKYGKMVLFRCGLYVLCFIYILPGVATLSVYTSPDVRFTASEWIEKNVPDKNKILTESANAIDLPIISPANSDRPLTKNFLVNSFFFYDLDQSAELQNNLYEAIQQADYIIIPTRRVFYNHTCFDSTLSQKSGKQTERCKELEKVYPLLNTYYQYLFSGKSGFQQVAQFSSYPTISFMGKTLLEFPDEDAEETWTVFDHPVIRIYKRISNDKSQISNQVANLKTDFSRYQIINYMLQNTTYKLYVADTPGKRETGLMYVVDKKDMGGLDGMIFKFPDSQPRSFWNKNTLSHLTLYWIQNNKVMGLSDLPPITETGTITTVSSPSSADTVIEIIK